MDLPRNLRGRFRRQHSLRRRLLNTSFIKSQSEHREKPVLVKKAQPSVITNLNHTIGLDKYINDLNQLNETKNPKEILDKIEDEVYIDSSVNSHINDIFDDFSMESPGSLRDQLMLDQFSLDKIQPEKSIFKNYNSREVSKTMSHVSSLVTGYTKIRPYRQIGDTLAVLQDIFHDNEITAISSREYYIQAMDSLNYLRLKFFHNFKLDQLLYDTLLRESNEANINKLTTSWIDSALESMKTEPTDHGYITNNGAFKSKK